MRLGKVPTSRKRTGAREGVAYVRPRLSAAYTRSSRSGCGTLGAGCATANILDTRESAGAFRGGPGGLKAGKLLKKRLRSERARKESPKPSLHAQLQPSPTLLTPSAPLCRVPGPPLVAAEDACEGLAPIDPGAEQAALRPHRQGHHGMSPRGAPWGWRGRVSSANRALEPPPRGPSSVSYCCRTRPDDGSPTTPPAPALMTGLPRASRPWTLRGLGSAPTSCKRCRLRPPQGAGRGVARGPSPGWEGAGKGRGARRMCGSACLPGGGADSAALPLVSPQSGPGAPRPHPVRPLEVTWRGGVHALSPAELPDRPGRRGFGSSDPPAPGKLLPSSPHRFPGAQTPGPSRRPKPGDSQSGGQCREVPRPLHFPASPTWKLSHRHFRPRP